jgi:hypothetical protein
MTDGCNGNCCISHRKNFAAATLETALSLGIFRVGRVDSRNPYRCLHDASIRFRRKCAGLADKYSWAARYRPSMQSGVIFFKLYSTMGLRMQSQQKRCIIASCGAVNKDNIFNHVIAAHCFLRIATISGIGLDTLSFTTTCTIENLYDQTCLTVDCMEKCPGHT